MKKHTRIKLMTKMLLFLSVFIFAILLQIALTNYQSNHILAPINQSTGNIQNISQFINYIDSSQTALSNFRWEYGDSRALIMQLESEKELAELLFSRIDRNLKQVGKDEYLLANAAKTVYTSYTSSLEELVEKLKKNQLTEASRLYYDEIQMKGYYLDLYSQQLLNRAILDNQERYTRLSEKNEILRKVQFCAFSLCFIFGAAVTVSIVRLLRFIRTMADSSLEISRGNLDTPDIDDEREDEIGVMTSAFNEMKHSMKNQVKLLEEKNAMAGELYKKENEALGLQNLLEREKLQMLRSQINPHFLFNTLNVIKLTSEEEGARKTEQMIASLAKLYRFVLQNNDTEVILSREIMIVNEFYALNRARFGDRMSLVWKISPELDLTETLIPSFLLQPIVENAFKHGLGPKEEKGTITVELYEKDGILHAAVEDDGVGMNSAELKKLQDNLINPPLSGTHIGLYNIAARLKLWDASSGIAVSSEEGKGTRVDIYLPYETNDNLDETEDGEEEAGNA
jgi:Predicted signal transduction protein with a C-terminal ATPase domain